MPMIVNADFAIASATEVRFGTCLELASAELWREDILDSNPGRQSRLFHLARRSI